MRKAIAFILIISLSYYHIISLMITEIGLYANAQQHKLESACGNETIFSLTKSEFKRYRHGEDELYVKGELYDIKKAVSYGNEIIVICLDDKVETSLMADLDNFFNKNTSPQSSSAPDLLLKFLSIVYVPSFYSKGFKADESSLICFQSTTVKIPVSFFSVETPPPRG